MMERATSNQLLIATIIISTSCILVGAGSSRAKLDYTQQESVLTNQNLKFDQTTSKKCQAVTSPFCDIKDYRTVAPFNNTLGHKDADTAVAELHKYGYLFNVEPCKSVIQLFLCSLYFPVCVDTDAVKIDSLLMPCREDCEKVKKYCANNVQQVYQGWPQEWECSRFQYSRDDPMCVIKNNKDRDNQTLATSHNSPAQKPSIIPSGDTIEETSNAPSLFTQQGAQANKTICSDDLFDCQLKDLVRNRAALCIERRWVCDGKKDCIIEGQSDSLDEFGLDEIGCEKKCGFDQHYCDGKCIGRSDICNGKVDCSSGSDEQDCYDNLAGLIQSILCIFASISAIYLLIRFFRGYDEPKIAETSEPSYEDNYAEAQYSSTDKNLNQLYHGSCVPDSGPVTQTIGKEVMPQFTDNTTQNYPVYNEPMYLSIAGDIIYSREIFGDPSGADSGSVYSRYYGQQQLAYDSKNRLRLHQLPTSSSHEPNRMSPFSTLQPALQRTHLTGCPSPIVNSRPMSTTPPPRSHSTSSPSPTPMTARQSPSTPPPPPSNTPAQQIYYNESIDQNFTISRPICKHESPI